ncbi:molybdopterin-dependent oxidoreductase [Arabiibacter massiliensis]|uniref:molybdopterin-dependent oxidoreductase n=1 Tax=Arabiibacter massiliensis TaxID=1870985 RepID=UPI0009BA9887|nr:molybdopterin-dependent oxidoreductase [Arabiibacter massiliensis]
MEHPTKTGRHLTELSRRSFVKAASAATAALAATGALAGCANQVGEAEPVAEQPAGEWVPAACWHNCGGRCVNKVLVEDGVIVRQKTDDTHEDSIERPQYRGCLRGRSQRKQVFAEDRLKYPMKRKGWQPGGGESSNGQMRGRDEWERISWDEAIAYIADEVRRIIDAHGNRSILAYGGEASKVLSLLGGYMPEWGTGSYGSWAQTSSIVGIDRGWPALGINDRIDIADNTDVIVTFGMNPAWSAPGNPCNYLNHMRKDGMKMVAVDPFYNDTYSMMGAEWIPVRPSTNTPLLLGVAYAMLEMDDEKHLIDWDFLDRCTIGFDADHMPEGEDPAGNFKDYVLGTYDGTPKTPEWASRFCGAAPEQIRRLAELCGKDNAVAILLTWGSARTHNNDTLPQLVMTIGAMGGHYGKPGHMCGISSHMHAMNGGPGIIKPGDSGQGSVANPLAATEGVNRTELWKAILEGKYTYGGTMMKKVPGEVRDLDIKMIYHDAMSASLQTSDGQAQGIEAHRKVEFVVSHAMFLTTNAKYSDIVLPITSMWEVEGGFSSLGTGREMVLYWSKVVEPLFECKPDAEIAKLLGDKLGVDCSEIYPISGKQALFNQLLGATILDEAGKSKPFLTITEQDVSDWECEGAPQEGVVSINEFIEQGSYQVKRTSGDGYGYIAYQAFVEDPEANPLDTESGKMEIYSKRLKEQINCFGFSQPIEAIPTYIPSREGVEATFSDFEAGIKGDYPFQAFNPHYLRRSHTVFDNVGWLREAWENPVFLNAQDAADKGIAAGDTVLITSPHGKSLRKACVTNRFMPGVVGVPHGAWVDVDEETGVDKAGSDNYLTGQIQTGQGTSGWNSCICNIEKYAEDLPADADVAPRIPAAQN